MRYFVTTVAVVFFLVGCGRSESESSLSGRNQDKQRHQNQQQYDQGRFPVGPNDNLTPGKLCDRPDYYRYPEKIAYCERNVEKELKAEIIRTYDRELGFEIGLMNRMDFKIDHLIPLCMGGSNDEDNLWPQHASVYNRTDPLEPALCELMSQGRMKQAEAKERILRAKHYLSVADRMVAELHNMLGK